MITTEYTGPVCKGSWALGNNCKVCERCLATKPAMTTCPPDELPAAAIENLRQDMDGIFVGVSRQALDEVLAYLSQHFERKS